MSSDFLFYPCDPDIITDHHLQFIVPDPDTDPPLSPPPPLRDDSSISYTHHILHDLFSTAAAAAHLHSAPNPVEVDSFPSVYHSSPPSQQLENLSLCRATHLQTTAPPKDASFCCDAFLENAVVASSPCKYMQRSYSTNNFFNGTTTTTTRPNHQHLVQPPPPPPPPPLDFDFDLSSPESSFLSGQMMRRVYSTGDLQRVKTPSNSSTSSCCSAAEEAGLNRAVRKYSAEERKEKIQKYRAKRAQRNFNKTIKYACRKTLADSRPRIRGRFARNDEVGETPKAEAEAAAPGFTRDDDDDDLWFGLQAEEDHYNGAARGGGGGGGTFLASFGHTRFQYHGC